MSHNLVLRVISALILAPLFVISIVWLEYLYYLIMILIGILMLQEWFNMTKNTGYIKYGPIIILVAITSLIMIRYYFGYVMTILYFFSLWSVDTFAMIGGKTIGGPHMAPKLSPNKTWSGLFCGVLSSAICCYVIGQLFGINNFIINLFLYGMINGFVGQGSDLFISYFKRKCGVKDSGNLIPGHGGVLDRFDGTIFSAPLLLILLNL